MSYPDGPYFPNTELVAEAWLGQRVPGLTPAIVGTGLPKDTTKWAQTGFVQLTGTPRTVDVEVPQNIRGMVTLDLWATGNADAKTSSIKPPWPLAARLVELIRRATWDQVYGAPVELRPDFLGVRVQSVYLGQDARKITDDPSGYARFTLDLAVDWVPA